MHNAFKLSIILLYAMHSRKLLTFRAEVWSQRICEIFYGTFFGTMIVNWDVNANCLLEFKSLFLLMVGHGVNWQQHWVKREFLRKKEKKWEFFVTSLWFSLKILRLSVSSALFCSATSRWNKLPICKFLRIFIFSVLFLQTFRFVTKWKFNKIEFPIKTLKIINLMNNRA